MSSVNKYYKVFINIYKKVNFLGVRQKCIIFANTFILSFINNGLNKRKGRW